MKASPPQIIKEAETLKSALSGESQSSNTAWHRRQELCHLLELVLLTDLDYALDKKVEQDLWNYAFRNPISAFQTKAKEQKNVNHAHTQSQLANLLETASGFYLQLLQKLCFAYDIELPCHPRDSTFGLQEDWKKKQQVLSNPRKSSILYICQHCLVHLGDIARYRGQSLQAETFYRHAVELVPSNGQPYNQLAILEAASGEKLSTVFFYVRSLAVQHPFPAAATNLQKLFSKMVSDGCSFEGKTRMSAFEYITGFLHFHAAVHLGSDLRKAERMLCQLIASLPALIIAEKMETWQLIQMAAICMFAAEHAWGNLDWERGKQETELISADEKKSASLVVEMLASMLHSFLLPIHASLEPKDSAEFYCVPAIKIVIDWLLQDPKVLQQEGFVRRPQIWPGFCKLLNDLQIAVPSTFDAKKYDGMPLPEDWDLQCFLPMKKSHRNLKFPSQAEFPTDKENDWLRAIRLRESGKWLSENAAESKKVLSYGKSPNGEFQFTAVQQVEALSEQVLQQIQELTVANNTNHSPLSNTGEEGNGKPVVTGQNSSLNEYSSSLRSVKSQSEGSIPEVRFKLDEEQQRKDLSDRCIITPEAVNDKTDRRNTMKEVS